MPKPVTVTFASIEQAEQVHRLVRDMNEENVELYSHEGLGNHEQERALADAIKEARTDA